LLIGVTKLAGDWRYRHDVETFLSAAGLQVDFSEAMDFFAFSICRIDVIELNGWLNVLSDWIGKSASSAGCEIVERGIAEIRQEVKEHEFFVGGLRSTLEGKIAAVENVKMEFEAKVYEAGAKWEEPQREIKALKERETQIHANLLHLGAIERRQRKELQILQSRSPCSAFCTETGFAKPTQSFGIAAEYAIDLRGGELITEGGHHFARLSRV
jgi:hypothetical protein